jgi:hypothetical protein
MAKSERWMVIKLIARLLALVRSKVDSHWSRGVTGLNNDTGREERRHLFSTLVSTCPARPS